MSFWKGLFGKDAPKQQTANPQDINEHVPSEVGTKNFQGASPTDAASTPINKDDRVVRVFISSTFRDMMAERDYLVKFTFPQLRKLCESRGVTWGEVDLRWGVTDEQSADGKVLPICLEEIKRCRPYFIGILGERYGWVPDSIATELLENEPWLAEQCEGRKSVTELEILHGVLNDPAMAGHAFFYFRDPRKSMEVEAKLKEEAGYQLAPPDLAVKLTSLKERIRQSGFPVREDYPTPEDFGALVLADLTEVINSLYPEGSEPELLDREATDHEIYARSRAQVYIGRGEYFKRLDEHAAGREDQPLAVLGESGSGKSALLANWAIQYREQHPDALVIQHYIGASPYSADWAAMVRRIMGEFKRNLNIDETIPAKPDELRDAFPVWLHMASAQKKVVLIIDALNQLEDTDGAPDLRWLPSITPPNLRLFVSTLLGRPLEAINHRGWPVFNIVPLDVKERKELINEYLKVRAKSLEPIRVEVIASAPQAANPLYLRVLLNELCVWGVYERLDERIDHYLEAKNPYKLYEKVLVRWEEDYEGDSNLVGNALSMIWASRRGISETELLGVLGNEDGPLPHALWSPLYLAMSDSLIPRDGLLAFAHDYLRTAARDTYIPDINHQREAHLRLAEYFFQQDISQRQVDELPWLLWKAGERNRLRACILDIDRFRLICEHNEHELLSYWLWLKEEQAMGKVYLESFNKWHQESSRRDKDISDAANELGVFLNNAALHSDAEPLLKMSLAIEEKIRGPNHPKVATSLNNLAVLYIDQGEYTKAEPLYKRALSIQEKALGPEHPNVATILNNLAGLYQDQAEYAEAELLYKRALSIRENSLGLNHPDLSQSLNNLASFLQAQGEYANAEPLYRRALEVNEKVHGPEHPEVAKNLGNLAGLYQAQGEYADAKPLYKRALDILEKTFGHEHPCVATSLNNIASLHKAQGEYENAQALYERALEIKEKALGPNHLGVALCLNNLAQIYISLGQYTAAEPLYKRALSIREKTLGTEHPDVAVSLNDLALLYQAQSKYIESEPLYKRALAIQEKALGPEHLRVATSLNNLAGLYHVQCQYAAAEPLYKRALAIEEKTLGPEHPDISTSLNNLAGLYQAQAEYAEAEPLYQRALSIQEKALGTEHPKVATSLNNLAEIYRVSGVYALAEPLYKRALSIQEKTLGPVHFQTAGSLNNLALLYQGQGKYMQAEPLMRRHLDILLNVSKSNGRPHSFLQAAANNYAVLLKVMDRGPEQVLEKLNELGSPYGVKFGNTPDKGHQRTDVETTPTNRDGGNTMGNPKITSAKLDMSKRVARCDASGKPVDITTEDGYVLVEFECDGAFVVAANVFVYFLNQGQDGEIDLDITLFQGRGPSGVPEAKGKCSLDKVFAHAGKEHRLTLKIKYNESGSWFDSGSFSSFGSFGGMRGGPSFHEQTETIIAVEGSGGFRERFSFKTVSSEPEFDGFEIRVAS